LRDEQLHSLFAQIAGIGLTIAVVVSIFTSNTTQERMLNIFFLLLILGSVALFGLAQNGMIPFGQGMMQRMLWFFSLIWLIIEQHMILQNWLDHG
jgi:hypothetical protein